MSREHVESVFGPQWVQDRAAWQDERLRLAESITLVLRRKLREADPSLPDEYDGTAWGRLEREYRIGV